MNPSPRHGWARATRSKPRPSWRFTPKSAGAIPNRSRNCPSFLNEQGRKPEAAATLDRLNLIYLKDEEAHKKLGELDLDLGNAKGAVREFGAVLASSPIDVAGAHYELAKAYQAAHENKEAQDEVISALEAAPGFKPAQKLLLELNVKE
jgi:tetratricopeptide (TPR) repeat protein